MKPGDLVVTKHRETYLSWNLWWISSQNRMSKCGEVRCGELCLLIASSYEFHTNRRTKMLFIMTPRGDVGWLDEELCRGLT